MLMTSNSLGERLLQVLKAWGNSETGDEYSLAIPFKILHLLSSCQKSGVGGQRQGFPYSSKVQK